MVFYEEYSLCPFCKEKSNKNGRRIRYINRNKPVKIQKYVCSDENCGKFHETNLENIVPKNSNYAHKLRLEAIERLLISYNSLEKISEEIQRIYGCKPCRQTILNHKIEKYETHYKNKIEKSLKYNRNDLSGVYGYDKQFLTVNGEKRARLTLLDLNNNTVINQKIIKEFNVKKRLKTF